MIALVDADTIIYKIAITHQTEVDWGDGEPDTTFDESLAIKTLKNDLAEMLSTVECSKHELWLTGSNNFRHELGSYKENRKDKVLPVGLKVLRAYAMEHLEANMAEGMEADDVVVHLKNTQPDDYVLCAIDKDVLYQSVGTHFNYNKNEWVSVTKAEANRYMYFQVLTGDVTDGYKGCLRVGKVGAEKLLVNPNTYELSVAKAYKKAGHDYGYMLSQYRMASMNQWNGTEIVLMNLEMTEKEYNELRI